MNLVTKYIIFVFVSVVVAFIILKPIVTHENEYKVVIVNVSERPITSLTISGAGVSSRKIGPITVGRMQNFIFKPSQSGVLKYAITQDHEYFDGVINADLKIGDVGDVYIVVGEMHKVKILDDYGAAY